LVELLVVIGIISLLIAILLPALNKARQQANLIYCQSTMRQMGQALNIYVSENNGLLPWGDIRNDPHGTTPWEDGALPNATDQEFSWYWTFTLSQEIQTNLLGSDGFVHNLSRIFTDKDTIGQNTVPYINNYTCNPRIFPDNWEPDSLPGAVTVLPMNKTQRKLSNIKPASAFLIWDGPECADWNGNTYEQGTEIDGNNLTYGTYLFLGQPDPVTYVRPCSPGLIQSQSPINPSPYVALQKKWNIDLGVGQGYFDTQIRFRHLNNTAMNALCVDGHVETRTVGTFMVLDICIQPPG
jgi:type II secretory pathway pseudopilin PulG